MFISSADFMYPVALVTHSNLPFGGAYTRLYDTYGHTATVLSTCQQMAQQTEWPRMQHRRQTQGNRMKHALETACSQCAAGTSLGPTQTYYVGGSSLPLCNLSGKPDAGETCQIQKPWKTKPPSQQDKLQPCSALSVHLSSDMQGSSLGTTQPIHLWLSLLSPPARVPLSIVVDMFWSCALTGPWIKAFVQTLCVPLELPFRASSGKEQDILLKCSDFRSHWTLPNMGTFAKNLPYLLKYETITACPQLGGKALS